MESEMPQIRTRHEYPPIPDRRFDWCAWYDGDDGEHVDTGWGRTEAEAVADLLANFPRGSDTGGDERALARAAHEAGYLGLREYLELCERHGWAL
jgi:hypothetical protein